ncbi:MAG TPA: leucyl aminopeptidase [Anaerolineales bacterium]|nr:leucyl aminopeptidase [Anaerolineales bacterium]
MEIKVQTGDFLRTESELAVLGSFEDVPLPEDVAKLLEAGDFKSRPNQTLLLYPHGALTPKRMLLVGLGKSEKVKAETIRRASATVVNEVQKLKVSAFSVGINGDLPLEPEVVAQSFAEGVEMGAYRFWQYRTGLDEDQTFIVEQATVFSKSVEQTKVGLALGQAIARGVNFARDLVNEPGDVIHPQGLADEAIKLGERLGLKVTVLDMPQLIEQGFGGILAIGKGSDNEPRFIIMEYGEAKEDIPTICLVGKGLTFDSGGLSIKPADAMENMKNDMGGAAAVYGAMHTLAELKLPLHVVALIPSAENMPSSKACRPGDIVKTLSGKTIEVLNTDAEGRVILSDALFYAQRYKPDAIVELSTLTGAIIIALGAHASGLMGTDQALVDKLIRAGEVSGDRVWQLHMWDEYHEMVKSEIADLKNLAGRPAGSITAGTFLAAFVGDYPFAHIDVAGTAWVDRPVKPYETRGGTGAGVRLITDYLRQLLK